MDYDKKVTWHEPTENNEWEENTLTVRDAISHQRYAARYARPDFEYKDDEEALKDFLVVNCATVEGAPPCLYDPMLTDGCVSMHHCPECGMMVMAGMKHI